MTSRANRLCVDLGPTSIGNKTNDMGDGTFDKDVRVAFEDNEDAAFLLEETKNQLEKVHSSVYDETIQELITFPPQYDYGVESKKRGKARAMQFGDEALIKSRIAQLNKKTKLNAEDIREKKYLEDILDEKLPLSCEANVVLRVRNFFQHEPGICLHGFKPQDYLIRYIELAKEQRKTNPPLKLSKLEESMLKILNISITGIDKWVNEAIVKIETEQSKICPATSRYIPCDIIHAALDFNGKCEKERKPQYIELKKAFPIFKTKFDSKQNREVSVLDHQGNKIKHEFTKDEIIQKLINLPNYSFREIYRKRY